ncbi:hypothetical protein GWP40_03800 [Treponema vincentii]|nr:hypothetical protein [Treponema vincentii]QUY17587.1 hypothetical protein GWP40_03800 [Treponema vincentii]
MCAQNIAAVWNHCHPWQFWLSSPNYSAGMLKNGLMRLPAYRSVDRLS